MKKKGLIIAGICLVLLITLSFISAVDYSSKFYLNKQRTIAGTNDKLIVTKVTKDYVVVDINGISAEIRKQESAVIDKYNIYVEKIYYNTKSWKSSVRLKLTDAPVSVLNEDITNAIISCDIDYLKEIADADTLRAYCLNPNCEHKGCNYDKISAPQYALLNIKPERLVNVKITADDAFILYLNGVEKLRGNKWDKLYEKDILMSDGDIILIWAWDTGGSKWITFEAFDKETGELIFNSKVDSPTQWATFPDYKKWTVWDYTTQLNLFYDKNKYTYKGDIIPYKTTYDFKTGSFNESYNNIILVNGFDKINRQLNSNTKPVWGAYYDDLNSNPKLMSKFFIGKKIKFSEELT